jgi:hypothetical protein
VSLCIGSLSFDKLCSSIRQQKSDKPVKEITAEIQAIMRQITASVTFLPILSEPCSFDLLIYADKEATVPLLWEDSDPCLIQNAEQVRMRSFNTKVGHILFLMVLLFSDCFFVCNRFTKSTSLCHTSWMRLRYSLFCCLSQFVRIICLTQTIPFS